MRTFGDFLKENLISKGMSEAELSKRTGIAASTINSAINRNGNISVDKAIKICDALGCAVEDYAVFFDDKERTPLIGGDFAKKYCSLDTYGKEAVNCVLDVEYRRCRDVSDSE